MELKEIEQTPQESLITEYKFLCADLAEGLVYGVDRKLVDNAITVLTDLLNKPITLDGTNSRTYCETIYPYLKELS